MKKTVRGFAVVLYYAIRLLQVGLALFLLVGFFIYNPIFVGALEMARDVHQWEAPYIKASEEENFRTICPYWRDASWWQRHVGAYSDRSWCADYLDRLPKS